MNQLLLLGVAAIVVGMAMHPRNDDSFVAIGLRGVFIVWGSIVAVLLVLHGLDYVF